MRDSFNVASFLPFWRYAVCSEDQTIPGIPFYRRSSAEKFLRETRETLPWAKCYLLRRIGSMVDLVDYYHPEESPQ